MISAFFSTFRLCPLQSVLSCTIEKLPNTLNEARVPLPETYIVSPLSGYVGFFLHCKS